LSVAIYLVTGKLGSGKTLACVGRIRDALVAGKRVVTNLDLKLEHLLPRGLRVVSALRIPDKPTLADLEGIGIGNEVKDESRNGLIVLDELGAWLNTRSWGDKDRQPVIDWLLHSRKLGWDVYFIIQHENMVDKQVREGLAEFLVRCRRTDRLRIPFLTAVLGSVGLKVRPPQIHVATVRYGLDREALVSDRWWYRARDLYDAYDTRQVFTSAREGVYSLLSPWHLARLKGEGVPRWRLWLGLGAGAQPRPPGKPKLPFVVALLRLPAEHRLKVWHRLHAFGGAGAAAGD
jgi:Zonular occludens toxin (Zot)